MTAPAPELPVAWSFLLLRGLIDVLTTDGVCAPYSTSAYPTTSTAVVPVLQARPASPDRVLSFTDYPVSQDGYEPMDRVGVQVWMRYAGTSPVPVRSLAEAVRDSLDGLSAVTLSTGVSMSQCLRSSGTSLGADPSGRWTWVENFYVDAHHPTRHRN